MTTEVETLRAQKDGAYAERNQCVALIARMALALGWRVSVGRHPDLDVDWEDDWRTLLFVDLPTGQVTWHFHDSERHLLTVLPEAQQKWDGHDTSEKYRRVNAALAPAEPVRTPPQMACRRADICARTDGIICPEDSCDVEDGVYPAAEANATLLEPLRTEGAPKRCESRSRSDVCARGTGHGGCHEAEGGAVTWDDSCADEPLKQEQPDPHSTTVMVYGHSYRFVCKDVASKSGVALLAQERDALRDDADALRARVERFEAWLCAFEAETKATPVGAEDHARGQSIYNWRSWFCAQARAALAPEAPGEKESDT